MTERLEGAMQAARALPASMQDEIARIILAYAGGDENPIQLTAEELADLGDSDADVARAERMRA